MLEETEENLILPFFGRENTTAVKRRNPQWHTTHTLSEEDYITLSCPPKGSTECWEKVKKEIDDHCKREAATLIKKKIEEIRRGANSLSKDSDNLEREYQPVSNKVLIVFLIILI